MQKKQRYVVSTPFWHDGILLAKDSVIWLFPSEAKYKGHAVTEGQPIASPAPVAAPAVEAKPAKRKPSTAFVVEETPANGDNVN
jgi:hypothetical protein